MKFVAKCEKCGEQKILNEWGKCKRCLAIWVKKMFVPADRLTDKDSWYIFPIKQTQATIITDDFHGPQPDLAKIDKAIARTKKLEPGPCNHISVKGNIECKCEGKLFKSQIQNDPAPGKFIGSSLKGLVTKKSAKVQNELNRSMRKILHKGLETKDLRYIDGKCEEKI